MGKLIQNIEDWRAQGCPHFPVTVPSMDADRVSGKKLPSPPVREEWQREADMLLGCNGEPWPSDDERRAALHCAGYKLVKRHGRWITIAPSMARIVAPATMSELCAGLDATAI